MLHAHRLRKEPAPPLRLPQRFAPLTAQCDSQPGLHGSGMLVVFVRINLAAPAPAARVR